MVVSVCIGSTCHLAGSYNVIAAFQQMIEEHHLYNLVQVKASFCMGKCEKVGVCVKIDSAETQSVTGGTAKKFFEDNVLVAFQQ